MGKRKRRKIPAVLSSPQAAIGATTALLKKDGLLIDTQKAIEYLRDEDINRCQATFYFALDNNLYERVVSSLAQDGCIVPYGLWQTRPMVVVAKDIASTVEV